MSTNSWDLLFRQSKKTLPIILCDLCKIFRSLDSSHQLIAIRNQNLYYFNCVMPYAECQEQFCGKENAKIQISTNCIEIFREIFNLAGNRTTGSRLSHHVTVMSPFRVIFCLRFACMCLNGELPHFHLSDQ